MKNALKINFALWGMILCIILKICSPAEAQTSRNPCYNTNGSNCVGVGTTTPLPVTPSASAANGSTQFHIVAANSNNSTSLKATAGTIYSIQLGGIGAAPAYLKFYDKASAPTCQSDTIVSQFIIPAASTAANGGGSNISLPVGKSFTAGIAFCVVTGIADNDNTSVAAATFIINIDYK